MANTTNDKKSVLQAFDLLPNVFKSDVNRALFENGFQKFLTKPETKDVVGIIGTTTNQDQRIKEDTPQRNAQQLQPMVYNKTGTTESVMSFKDIMNELERVGVDPLRLHEWGEAEQFNFVPPIDIDKISNYRNYYWLGETTPQYVTIKNRSNQLETIINQAFADNAALYALYREYLIAPSPVLLDSMNTIYPDFSSLVLERDFIRQSDPLNQTNNTGWDAVTWDILDQVDYVYPLDTISILRVLGNGFVLSGNKSTLFNLTPDFTFRVNGSQSNNGVYQVTFAEYDNVNDETIVTVTTPLTLDTANLGMIDVGYYDNNFGVDVESIPNPNGILIQSDPWSKQNFWTHINDIPKNINVNVLVRAELPIIEYHPFIELNEWSYSKPKWKYRDSVGGEFESVTSIPSEREKHFIDRHLYQVSSILSDSIFISSTDNPPLQNQFNVGDDVTIEEAGYFDYYTILGVEYLAGVGLVRIDFDRRLPVNMDPEFTKLHNIRHTSRGDDWVGVYNHWVFDGMSNPIPCPAQQLNPTLIPGSDSYESESETIRSAGINTEWYKLDTISFIPNKDMIRLYVNNKRIYGSFNEGYFDGVTFTTDIPHGVLGNAVQLVGGIGSGYIRVETGPAAESDIFNMSVPVRITTTDDNIDIVRTSMIEYRKVEQIKTSVTQYPLFDVFNVDGSPTFEANSIWKFQESSDRVVSGLVDARIVVNGKDVKFEQQLLDDNGTMYAYKIRNATGSTLKTMWVQSESTPTYVPKYIDGNGDELPIGHPDGDWEIPKQMVHNLEHENRRILGTTQLNQHFKSIINSQPNPPGFNSDESKRWRVLDKPDVGLGGTIKEFNGGFDTLVSVVFNDVINIPKLIDFAASQYEDSVNTIRDIFESNIDKYLQSGDSKFLTDLTSAIADDVVNKFEQNGTRARVFGDSTSHNGTTGVRGWMATLPMIGLVRPVVPKAITDRVGGVYELTHHDGHVTSPIILDTVLNDIISRVVKTSHGASGLSADRFARTPDFPGFMYYETDTKLLHRFDVAHYGQIQPTWLAEGQYWFNTLTRQMFRLIDGRFLQRSPTEPWKTFDLNTVFIDVLLNVEQRLYAVCDSNYVTYDVDSIESDGLFNQYERREFDKFVKQFGIDASTTTSFSVVNPFTWNYKSVDVNQYRVRDIPSSWLSVPPSTWFKLYEDVFGTRHPNIEPWVMQGYPLKPIWWDTEYKGSGRRWTQQMWQNIIAGIVPNGYELPTGIISTGTPSVTKYSAVGVNITDNTTIEGNYEPDALLPPYFNSSYPEDLLAQQSGSLLSVPPLMSRADDGYDFGDNGPLEDLWRRSVYYSHSKVGICFKIDPMIFSSRVINPVISVIDGLRLDPVARKVPSHRDMRFHGEAYSDGVVKSNGMNQWFVNYLRYTSRDVVSSGFRSSWVEWRPKLGYQTSSFVDMKSLSIKTEVTPLDTSDINVVLKHTRGMIDKWIDALRVVVNKVGDHTVKFGVKVPTNNGDGWKFRVDTANPALRTVTLYGVRDDLPGTRYVPRLSGLPTGTWNRFEIDRNITHSYTPGTPISDMGPTFDGIQGLINFIDGYVAKLSDEGFNFTNTKYAYVDRETSRTIDWSFETDRLIEQIYSGMSSDELPVPFLGPWNYIFADVTTNAFVVANGLNIKEGDKVQLSTTGVLPVPFDTQQQYFVVNTTSNSFQLAKTAAGTPIPINTIGSGVLSVGTYRIEVVSPVSYHEVNPFRYGLVLDHSTGIVSDVVHNTFKDIDVEQGIYDQYGRPLRPENIRTYRSDTMTRFIADQNIPNDITRSTDVEDNLHISGAHIMINGFEHVILFNDTTIEGNTLFDEFLGASVSRFKVSMRTQAEKSFRPNVGGHYLNDGRIVQNIEASIDELQHLYDVNLADENSSAVKAARELVGFERTEYFDNMGITPKSQFLFHRGAIQNKGATKSVQAFINSKQFVEANVDEYWAYKVAEYGDARLQLYPEIKLLAQDAATDKLMLEFTTNGESAHTNFIDIKKDDTTRWYNHPDQMVDILDGTDNLSFESEVVTATDVSDYIAGSDSYVLLNEPCDSVNIIAYTQDTTPYQHVNPGTIGEVWTQVIDSTLLPNTDCVDVMIKPHDSSVFLPQAYGTCYTIGTGNTITVTHVDTGNGVREFESDDIIRIVPKDTVLIEGVHFDRVNAHVVRLNASFTQYGLSCKIYGLNVAATKLSPVKLIDYQANANIQSIPVWDPARDRHYHVSDHAIAVKSNIDPAHYNESFDNNINRNLAWYENNVGKIWWDTTKLGYTPYFDDKVITDTDTRITNWGKQTQWSKISLYEWVKSPVHPADYADYVESQQKAGESTQGSAKYSVLKRTRASSTSSFNDDWEELTDRILRHYVALDPLNAYVGDMFVDGEVVTVYRNGILDTTSSVVGGNVQLSNEYDMADYIDIVSERYEPTKKELEFNPDVKDDGRLIQYKKDYRYTVISKIDANDTDITDTYYFWVANTATNHNGMTIRNIAADLGKLPVPFVIFQNIVNGEYTQSIFRGLVDVINADDRYKLRFTKDFTLRDNIDDSESAVSLKNKHKEWALFREKQKFNIPKKLWDKMTEALTGRTLSGNGPLQPIPSLDRELFDSVNNTSHRFGLNEGQAFVNKERGIDTVLAELRDPEYDLFPIDREEFFATHSFDSPERIESALETIYNTFLPDTVNRIWFAVLHDGLADNVNYSGIIKTSWIQLDGVRLLDTTGDLT